MIEIVGGICWYFLFNFLDFSWVGCGEFGLLRALGFLYIRDVICCDWPGGVFKLGDFLLVLGARGVVWLSSISTANKLKIYSGDGEFLKLSDDQFIVEASPKKPSG